MCMKPTQIDNAVRVFNQNIKFYRRTINRQQNPKVKSFKHYETNLKKYWIVLNDMIAIKKAIQKNETEVVIRGTAESGDYAYEETTRVLEKLHFYFEIDGCTKVMWFLPVEECVEWFFWELRKKCMDR